MKKEKCIVFDFSKGQRENTAKCNYQSGQLDLDLMLEVKSPESAYGTNVLKFKGPEKIKKNGSSREELEEPFSIA